MFVILVSEGKKKNSIIFVISGNIKMSLVYTSCKTIYRLNNYIYNYNILIPPIYTIRSNPLD